MPTGKPIIYWDTCVILAWIKNESRPNNEMDGVNEVARQIHNNEVILLTSAFTDIEVLQSTLNDDARDKFDKLFKRKNCQKAAIDHRITALSSEIRDYYQSRKDIDQLPTITSPDAVHLATAIHYNADVFHTFDENNIINRRRALIPLSGNVAGHNLLICKPPLPRQSSFLPP